MADDFRYDVFLSHSSRDKTIVRDVAKGLRQNGLHVWFDEWEIRPGDSIPAKIEQGLEHSRVLVFCMSAHAFGDDWAQLESQTFRFRDPLNKARRFLPLRLDDAPIKGSLGQFLHIRWRPEEGVKRTLLEACRLSEQPASGLTEPVAEKVIELDYDLEPVNAYAFSPDGRQALTAAYDRSVRVWDLQSGRCLRRLEGHTGSVWDASPYSKDMKGPLWVWAGAPLAEPPIPATPKAGFVCGTYRNGLPRLESRKPEEQHRLYESVNLH